MNFAKTFLSFYKQSMYCKAASECITFQKVQKRLMKYEVKSLHNLQLFSKARIIITEQEIKN